MCVFIGYFFRSSRTVFPSERNKSPSIYYCTRDRDTLSSPAIDKKKKGKNEKKKAFDILRELTWVICIPQQTHFVPTAFFHFSRMRTVMRTLNAYRENVFYFAAAR